MKNKVKLFRTQNNLTQQDLAIKVGVSRQTIIAIENNKYLPSINLAFKLSKIFKTTIEKLFIYQP
ncbi:MAG: helix-turn-helix transcriptional regulator [Candidatus Shapirobacteria bacterium]|nr:helix-turn-helix transcriptional regulator [Candidatus Shapirobacteria bacterium]